MNTRIHIHHHGGMITVRLHSTAMASPISATLSGPYLYALVDGLLWWCINRKLDSLVACAMGQPAPANRDEALRFGNSLANGEELVMQCFTTPFHEHDEQRQERILAYLHKHLPSLNAMAQHGPHRATSMAELAELMELCTLLQQRIQHSGEAMHGIGGMITTTELQAA